MNGFIRLLERFVAFARRHAWWLVGATVGSGLGLLSLGLPGALAMSAFDLVWTAPDGWATPHGDTAWPNAILLSLAAPWLVFGVHLGLLPLGPWKRSWQHTLLSLLGALPLVFVWLVLYRSANR